MTPAAIVGKPGALEEASAIQEREWVLPDRGRVGVLCLIVTEFTIFSIFVVAYVFYIGKSLTGPTPSQVLELPIWATICLLSSSITVPSPWQVFLDAAHRSRFCYLGARCLRKSSRALRHQ